MSAPRVLVVGAGLGGLVAALALHHHGLRVEVREQAPALGEVGAGLTVSRGAQRVLAELGVLDALLDRASSVRSNAFLHYRTGALLDGAVDVSDGTPDRSTLVNLQVHRADLHAVLAAALARRVPGAVHLASRLSGLDDTGRGVVAHFADGSVTTADLVIGADGLRSQVRELLWGPEQPLFTGQVAYRALVPGEVARPFVQAAGRAAVYLGPGRVLNRYVLRRNEVVNCAAICRTDGWHEEGWATRADPAELLALYEGWHPDVLGLLGAAPPEGLRKWALYDREPLPQWRQGSVTLLGDAAHPMLPFLGLGSAMAVEDGLALARALAVSADGAGLDAYEQERRPRTTEVMLLSRVEGTLVQARDPDRFDPTTAPSRDPRLYDPHLYDASARAGSQVAP